jgi:hypothetical protein
MAERGMRSIVRCVSALVFLLPIVGVTGPAGAAREDCRPDRETHAFQCLWDQVDFHGNVMPVRPTDVTGLCINFSIRSAANNGASGTYTLYLYEHPGCAGDSISKLNAGEAVRSVTAQSARFAPKGAYR